MLKRGVIELPLHWIMIIIIGIAFLLFFGQTGFKLSESFKDVNNNLLVLDLRNVFLSASANSKTSSNVDLELENKVIKFEGEKFFIEENGKLIKGSKLNQFVFGDEISRNRVRIWSEAFELPFKVVNFVFVDDGKGFSLDVDSSSFSRNIKDELEDKGFNVNGEKVIKFVKKNVRNPCLDRNDENVRLIVVYEEDEIVHGEVCFYIDGDRVGDPLKFVTEELVYGAIFSNFEVYEVLYEKAIERLINIDKIYEEKVSNDNCRVIDFGDMGDYDYNDIDNIILTAKKIKEQNKDRVRKCGYVY